MVEEEKPYNKKQLVGFVIIGFSISAVFFYTLNGSKF
jgi:hypothetical protein